MVNTKDTINNRVEQRYNRPEQHEGSLHPEGHVVYPPEPSLGPDPTRPSNSPVEPSIDAIKPVDLEELRKNQDTLET